MPLLPVDESPSELAGDLEPLSVVRRLEVDSRLVLYFIQALTLRRNFETVEAAVALNEGRQLTRVDCKYSAALSSLATAIVLSVVPLVWTGASLAHTDIVPVGVGSVDSHRVRHSVHIASAPFVDDSADIVDSLFVDRQCNSAPFACTGFVRLVGPVVVLASTPVAVERVPCRLPPAFATVVSLRLAAVASQSRPAREL